MSVPMQSIIVYRNPLEAAMWEGLSGGSFVPVFSGIIVFFAVFLTLNKLIGSYWQVRETPWYRRSNFHLLVGGVAGVFTLWYLL